MSLSDRRPRSPFSVKCHSRMGSLRNSCSDSVTATPSEPSTLKTTTSPAAIIAVNSRMNWRSDSVTSAARQRRAASRRAAPVACSKVTGSARGSSGSDALAAQKLVFVAGAAFAVAAASGVDAAQKLLLAGSASGVAAGTSSASPQAGGTPARCVGAGGCLSPSQVTVAAGRGSCCAPQAAAASSAVGSSSPMAQAQLTRAPTPPAASSAVQALQSVASPNRAAMAA
mmetsp:Transcript_20268/g.60451  ORF Transcript_20268/g.60451 Transcript_20268/m.60451 type:complete len:227 (-) Transcript_20268:167-847(-)